MSYKRTCVVLDNILHILTYTGLQAYYFLTEKVTLIGLIIAYKTK